jgi:hypothetical protein
MVRGGDEQLLHSLASMSDTAESTRMVYVGRVRGMLPRLGAPSVRALMRDAGGQYRQAVESGRLSASVLTSRNMAVAVLALFKANPDERCHAAGKRGYAGWRDTARRLRDLMDIAYARNQPLNERQRRNYVGYAEIDAVYTGLRAVKPASRAHLTLHDSQTLVLLAFYAHLVPRRSDLGAVRIVHGTKKDGCGNRVELLLLQPRIRSGGQTKGVAAGRKQQRGVVAAPRLVLEDYKTAGTYHSTEEELPPPLVGVLLESLRRWPRDHLFVSPHTARPMTRDVYSKYVRRVFAERFDGRAAGTALLRHAYITERVDFNAMSTVERERIAHLMGHSLDTQGRIYKWVDWPTDKSNHTLPPTPNRPS